MEVEGLKHYNSFINTTLNDKVLMKEFTYDKVMELQSKLITIEPQAFKDLEANKRTIEDFNGRQWKEIYDFYNKGLFIIPYLNPSHSAEYLNNILNGIKDDATISDIDKYLNNVKYFNSNTLENRVIADSEYVQEKLRTYKETNKYSNEQLEAIKIGLERNIKPSYFDNCTYTPTQMRVIIRGIAMGVNLQALADVDESIFKLLDKAIYNDVKQEFLKLFFVGCSRSFLEKSLEVIINKDEAQLQKLQEIRLIVGISLKNKLECDSIDNLLNNYTADKINLILNITKYGYNFKGKMSSDLTVEELETILSELK